MLFISIILYEIVFLSLSGFLSGFETGIVSIRISKIEEEKKMKFPQKWLANKFSNIEKLVSVCLVGTNIFLIITIILLLYFFIKSGFSASLSETMTIIFLTPISLVISEILPKSLFRRYPELIFKSSFIFWIFYYLLLPFLFLFYSLPKKIIDLFVLKQTTKKFKTQQQLRFALTQIEKEEGIESEGSFVERIFEIGEKQVKEILIPMKKVIKINSNATIKDAKEIFEATKHSRIPIYDETKEEFIGFVNFLDIFLFDGNPLDKVSKISKPLLLVDDNEYLDNLLFRMQREKVYLVSVINKIGETIGIVTIKDLLEELVGEY
jgi:CBS domain containing-hemolysin-like protein